MPDTRRTVHNGAETVHVSASSIDEVMKYLFPDKIRPRSREFYRREVISNLKEDGEALVDRHAGRGAFYKIKLQR